MINHFYLPVNTGYRTSTVRNHTIKPSNVYTKWLKIGKVKIMISYPIKPRKGIDRDKVYDVLFFGALGSFFAFGIVYNVLTVFGIVR